MMGKSEQLYTVPIKDLKSYLELQSWSLKNENENWLVFEGNHFVDIVLAKDTLAPDYHVYVDHMVKTLSSERGTPPESIASEIYAFDRDVLTVSVDAASVDNAAGLMPPIKRLIGHAANMERSLKRHFSQYYLEARNMLKHFAVTQEFNDNGYYRVESQVGEKEPYQMNLLCHSLDPGEKLPLERRVMERIATGLMAVEFSAKKRDLQYLIDSYADGFNANMCSAILDISKLAPIPITFGLKWSGKLPASQSVIKLDRILVNSLHLDYLKRARDKHKEWRPKFQSIEGRVIGLSSLDDPRADNADNSERSIVVSLTNHNAQGKKLWINLDKEDYITAHKAHIEWKVISVDGFAVKRRAGWQLAYPQDFKILR